MSEIPNSKRLDCANYALHAYGTAYIFEKRASSIQKKIKWLSFLGVAVPASVGVIVGTYALDETQIGLLLFVASLISIVQLLLSIWSLSSNWNSNLSDYLNLKNKSSSISDKYEKLGKETVLDFSFFQANLDKFDIERVLIKQLADRHSIKESEKRRGMRYALRKFQRACAGCNVVPTNMKNTKCGICGEF